MQLDSEELVNLTDEEQYNYELANSSFLQHDPYDSTPRSVTFEASPNLSAVDMRRHFYTDPLAHGFDQTEAPLFSDPIPASLPERFQPALSAIYHSYGQNDFLSPEDIDIFNHISDMSNVPSLGNISSVVLESKEASPLYVPPDDSPPSSDEDMVISTPLNEADLDFLLANISTVSYPFPPSNLPLNPNFSKYRHLYPPKFGSKEIKVLESFLERMLESDADQYIQLLLHFDKDLVIAPPPHNGAYPWESNSLAQLFEDILVDDRTTSPDILDYSPLFDYPVGVLTISEIFKLDSLLNSLNTSARLEYLRLINLNPEVFAQTYHSFHFRMDREATAQSDLPSLIEVPPRAPTGSIAENFTVDFSSATLQLDVSNHQLFHLIPSFTNADSNDFSQVNERLIHLQAAEDSDDLQRQLTVDMANSRASIFDISHLSTPFYHTTGVNNIVPDILSRDSLSSFPSSSPINDNIGGRPWCNKDLDFFFDDFFNNLTLPLAHPPFLNHFTYPENTLTPNQMLRMDILFSSMDMEIAAIYIGLFRRNPSAFLDAADRHHRRFNPDFNPFEIIDSPIDK